MKTWCARLFVFAFVITGSSLPAAASSLLLRSVSLIDPDRPGEVVSVNMLIREDKLDLVSRDEIPVGGTTTVYDAQGGFVLGHLNLGEPASFMVMDGNPRENIDVLLDTKSHTVFAIRKGDVLRNRLSEQPNAQRDGEGNAAGGWLAYTPPPLALPLGYRDESKFNRFRTKYVSGIFASGILMDRQNWLSQNSGSSEQVGDLEVFDGGEIRGFRVGGVGTLNFERPWVWTIFGATHAFDKGFDVRKNDEFSFFDVRLDIPTFEGITVSIGKQKEPISMARLMTMVHQPMQERPAVADAVLPSRNVGLVVSGSALDERVSWAAGAFNNWLDKDQPNSFSDNATQYVGRATAVAWESADENTLVHLGVGYRFSDAKEGVVIGTEPEFNQAPNFVGAEAFPADRIDTWQAEASLRSGPLWVYGEWTRADVEASEMGDPSVDGYHVTASFALSGEVRGYNKRTGLFKPLPIARTVNQNGWGAWEVGVRYSNLDANDGLLEAGDMDIWSAGISWWLTPQLTLSLNYRHITLERYGEEGQSQGINTRLIMGLE